MTATGRLVNEDKLYYYIVQNPFATDQVRKIAKKSVVSFQYSPVSIMIPGLLGNLNNGELKDLIAYLKAGGKPDASFYKSSEAR